jgi:hypothetical protein
LPRAAICRFAVRPRSGSVTQPADLKHHAGLAHLPSRRFTANAAGLALVGIAYNLARWTANAAGLGRITTKTLRLTIIVTPARAPPAPDASGYGCRPDGQRPTTSPPP